MSKKQDLEDGADKSGPAVVVTVAWTGVVISYVMLRWENFNRLQPNEVGDFLAGAFGPVALLWLVFGYLQQGRELRMQAKELRNAVEQHKELVSATRDQIAEDSLARKEDLEHARQQVRPEFEGQILRGVGLSGEIEWIIQIKATGPECRGVTAKLLMVAEKVPLPILLVEYVVPDGSVIPNEWHGKLPMSTAIPDVLHIQCVTLRNEMENQQYRIVQSVLNLWVLDARPLIANATPIRYPA